MSVSKLAIPLILLATAATAHAQAAPPQAQLDERVTKQITPGAGLTADEAARRARAASLAIDAQRDEIDAARALVDQAKAGYIPRLVATARYTRLSDLEQGSAGSIVVAPGADPGPLPADTMFFNAALSFPVILNSTLLQVQLQIPVSDYLLRVPQSVEAARGGAGAAEQQLVVTEQKVQTDARLSFYTWVRARLQVTVAEQAVEQAKAHLEDARKAYNVGSASKADTLRIESSLAQADLGVVRAKNVAELAEAQLRTAMRDTSGAPYTIGEDVLADLAAGDEDLEALTKVAWSKRPELRVLDENVVAVRGRAKVQQAGYLPRVDLFANASYANPNQRVFPQADEFRGSWEAGAMLTWTPTDIPLVRAQVRETRARAAALNAQRENLADGIRLEVLAALQGVREARAAVAASVQTLATASEAYRVRRALFQNGRATSLELSDAELDLTRARLDSINARVDLRVARARLLRATGQE